MFKKIFFMMLCFSGIEIYASSAGDEAGIYEDKTGAVHMRSVKAEDTDEFIALMETLKTNPTNPTGGSALIKAAVDRRVTEGSPYHMMRFSLSDDASAVAFVAQGRMPVFGFSAGTSYNPVEHAAIIEKWKSLGVRVTVDGDHDERVENFGLLNLVPFIHPGIDEATRIEIYSKMLVRARTLKAEGALMNAENNHLLDCTDKALPKHILLLVHPDFRDIALLQSMGFELDGNPEFEKFYNVPRVMLTYDLTAEAK